MARVTIEDCLQNVDNMYELVHLATRRARQLFKGADPLVKSKNRVIVTSLREIAAGRVTAVVEKADVKNLTGPVGLVSVVGDAQKIGAVFVIMLMAMISINLAVLNIIPFPALDGGRVLIVIIETITRRKINPNVVAWVNGIGFLLLITLMIFISVKDVIKLF